MLVTTAFSSVSAFRFATKRPSESGSNNSFPLKLRASLHDYPLASKIVVKKKDSLREEVADTWMQQFQSK
ncbi:hypothetical protein K1719_042691 [Acacia pycnantha]|nr:hypothetical protein K1719_042691 [Acacia pycnantha]